MKRTHFLVCLFLFFYKNWEFQLKRALVAILVEDFVKKKKEIRELKRKTTELEKKIMNGRKKEAKSIQNALKYDWLDGLLNIFRIFSSCPIADKWILKIIHLWKKKRITNWQPFHSKLCVESFALNDWLTDVARASFIKPFCYREHEHPMMKAIECSHGCCCCCY